MTMIRIITPGTMEVCGLVISADRASPSIDPRSACGGCDPSPRKDSPAVSRIIQPMVVDMAITMTGITLGRISVRMIRRCPSPANLAASTNSLCAIPTVTPRMLRAKNGMFTAATAIKALVSPGPKAATIASASRM